MRRILLIPSTDGGGKGHVSRCHYLAKLLQKQNNETAIVLESKHYNHFSTGEIKTYLLDTSKERFIKYQLKRPFKPGLHLNTRIYKRPVFIEFNSLAYQVPRDGYWTSKLVKYRFEKLSKIIDNFRPDILIGDAHFLTFLCGHKYEIPVIQITRLAGYPLNPEFMWWKNEDTDLIAPLALEPFREIISDLNLDEINKAEDLLAGDHYIIPAIPEIEPVQGKDNKTTYSGALATTDYLHQDIPFFNTKNNISKIYISIGGGAGRSNEKKFFNEILSIFNKKNFDVLVSTGNKVKASLYNNKSHNVYFVDWIHGPSAIKKSDLIIYHGGYGTTLEVISNAKPSIVLPSHTEQEGNGRRLEELGVGKTILFSKERRQLKFNWPFGDYTMNAGFDFNLNGEEILYTVNQLLENSYHQKLKSVRTTLEKTKEEFNINHIINSI